MAERGKEKPGDSQTTSLQKVLKYSELAIPIINISLVSRNFSPEPVINMIFENFPLLIRADFLNYHIADHRVTARCRLFTPSNCSKVPYLVLIFDAFLTAFNCPVH
jgi:hypothetical protein